MISVSYTVYDTFRSDMFQMVVHNYLCKFSKDIRNDKFNNYITS